jgi:hypothetical protein
MKISEALAKSAAVKPSQYTDADKIAWLATLDGIIDAEVIRTHEDAPEAAYTPYASNVDTSTVLIVPDPWSQLYVTYICSMIDFYNGEAVRYNNSNARYEAEYAAFAAWYNRNHLPLQPNVIKLGNVAAADAFNPLDL